MNGIVSVAGPQALNAEGRPMVGPELMVTSALPLAPQPLAEMVMARCTLPLAPAVYVMLRVPAPAVIVPLMIDQLYVAPAPAFGTLAELPGESWQAVPPVVIVAAGIGLMTTVVDA